MRLQKSLRIHVASFREWHPQNCRMMGLVQERRGLPAQGPEWKEHPTPGRQTQVARGPQEATPGRTLAHPLLLRLSIVVAP